MVPHTAADTLVCAHRSLVKSGHESLLAGPEHLLFLCGGLDDPAEFFLLGGKVVLADGDVVGELVKVTALAFDALAGFPYVLLGNLTEDVLVLEILVDCIKFAAVGDVLELFLSSCNLRVQIHDLLLVILDGSVKSVDNFLNMSAF